MSLHLAQNCCLPDDSNNFMPYIDLHVHSTASDGTFAPREVARLAREAGLSGWALTDHDTVGGLTDAADESLRQGIDFIAGIEISAQSPTPGTMHILGYGIDPQSKVLREMTATLREGRDSRNPKIIAKLQELGVSITMDELMQEATGGAPELRNKPIGRPHIATILVRKGYVSSVPEAFNKYLAPGGLAYFDKERLSPRDALSMILQSGGLPVLAHPVQLKTRDDEQLRQIVGELAEQGLRGIEVIHSDHTPVQTEFYKHLAHEYELLITGGSDFHGSSKKGISIGLAAGRRIPREYFDALNEQIEAAHVAH